MTKRHIRGVFVAPIILAILMSDRGYAASSKADITFHGSVTIETPSCGNQPQFGKGCASESHPASDTKLNFRDTETGIQFEIRTDHSGLFKTTLPPGDYLVILDSNPLVQSISPSQLNIRDKEMNRIDFRIIEKIQ